ncbi:zygotic DNA replication licensing factor mcm3-like [Artemia franciscana]|uniref:zygotic DNA replication licensing factor mcm3-like n=1 Tax=Artemia franciscana TaxID=6661 RepID=UPI0032DA0667
MMLTAESSPAQDFVSPKAGFKCFDASRPKRQPVTARALETLIRLSTAHARTMMSKKVEADDAAAAIELLLYACFKTRTGASDVYDFESDDDVVLPSTLRASRGSRSERSTTDTQASIQTDGSSQERGITKERFELFRNTIRELMVARNAQTVEMSIVRSTLETKTGSGMFTDEEVRVAIDFMTEENQIMVADDMISLI